MVANIEEVLQRGEALSALDSKANNLSSLSKKYRQDAKYLNMRSIYAKLTAVAVFFIMLIVYVRFWWLWNSDPLAEVNLEPSRYTFSGSWAHRDVY